jgi:hypothetical protein
MDSQRRASGDGALLYVLLGLIGLGAVLLLQDRLRFSPDSWTLYELSRTLFGDFYSVRHVRNFEQVGPYSSSFPLLWPVIVGFVDHISGWGPRVAFICALLSWVAFVLVSEKLGRALFRAPWIGFTSAVLTFTHTGYWGEVIAGRTIPLQLVLYALGLWICVDKPISAARALLAGVVLGLAVLNRFDAMLVALALPFLAQILRRAGTIFIPYYAGFLIGLSPWIWYSWTKFGTLFSTDNAGVVFSAQQRHVADWFLRTPPSAVDAPFDWLLKVAGNAIKTAKAIFLSPGVAGVVALICAFAVLALELRRCPAAGKIERSPVQIASRLWRDHRGAIFALLVITALLPSYVLTGYFDGRYFAPLWWIVLLLLFGFLMTHLPPVERRQAGFRTAIVALLLTVVLGAPIALNIEPRSFPVESPEDDHVARCLPADPHQSAILHADATEAARLSAIYGWRTVLTPRNIAQFDRPTVHAFLDRYQVRFAAGALLKPLREHGGFIAISGCPKGWFQRDLAAREKLNPS